MIKIVSIPPGLLKTSPLPIPEKWLPKGPVASRPLPEYVEQTPLTYNLLIISLSNFRSYFFNETRYLMQDYNIHPSEGEPLYDWVVREALNAVLVFQHAKVENHYRHDIYKCIYSHIGSVAERAVRHQINNHRLQFLKGELVKIMIAGDNIIMARGI